MRPRLRLAARAGVALAGAAGLAAAHPPITTSQITTSSGDALLAASAWAAALGCCSWLALVTLASLVAIGSGHTRAARVAARCGPKRVGLLVELAITGSALIIMVPPAHAAPVVRAAVADEPVVRTPAVAVSPVRPIVPVPSHAVRPTAAPHRTHVVRSGENLWSIARGELRARGAARVDNAAVAAYWRRVVAGNRATLRSRDPSLIYPGEIVALPASH